MKKKTRKRFTQQQKDEALEDYHSGVRSAQQIAEDLNTDVQSIYRWKVARDEKAKGTRIDELIDEGNSPVQAKRILELEQEIEEYKKKLAEQVLINDLLKKLQCGNSQPESELTGLIRTTKKSDRKKRRVK